MKNSKRTAGILFVWLVLALFSMSSRAGVTVVQNVSPGATNWPGNPMISTMSNLNTTAVTNESFTGGGGNTNISQTFSVLTTNITLQSIDLYVGGTAGTGTGGTTNLKVNLFDLGVQAAPNPTTYTYSEVGKNLLGSGAGLSVSLVNQPLGVLEFDFTGADQATLKQGHMYVFELVGTNNSKPIFWQRANTDTYTGGTAYRTQTWLNGTNTQDFAMAVYGAAVATTPPPPPGSGNSTVNWNDVHQKMDGFGGAIVFANPGSLEPITPANMDTLFKASNTNQLGLNILRIRIDPTTNWTAMLQDGTNAASRGASILATPWTPPTAFKSNNNPVGGTVPTAQFTNYANYLNSFAAFMKNGQAPLRAISMQNEPDVTVTYESCSWTSNSMQLFCNNVGNLITNAPLLMPESFQYNRNMSDPTLNDPVAAANMSIIGLHLYGNGDAGVTVVDYPLAHSKGKPLWMTEFLVNDQTMGAAIATARQIHNCLTVADMSAFIMWKTLSDANGLVSGSGVPQRRGYVFSQWSRFVHTNYFRIATTSDNPNSEVTAFKDPNGSGFAIVAVNTNETTTINQTFNLTNFNATIVTPWVTTATTSLGVQAPVTVTNGSFSYALPGYSVITFVGNSNVTPPNNPPVLTPISDQTVGAGVTLVLTNVATDPDAGQTLTFSLLTGPGNATLNTNSGVFTWRPLVSQANSTNAVSVSVSDNGTPVLSATNNFKVIVNPLGAVSFGSVSVSGGQAHLLVNGPFGPDYTLLGSTNLVNWAVVTVTNSPTLPVLLTDPGISTNPINFYKIQIGP